MSKYPERKLAQLRKRNIGFIFQSFNLIDELTVFANVELPLLYQRVPRRRAQAARGRRAREGRDHRAARPPAAAAVGRPAAARRGRARARVAAPKLILADEPTGNLDTTNGEEVMKLLVQLNEEGTTVIMVTHSRSHAEYGRRVVNMLDGRVLSENVRSARDRAGRRPMVRSYLTTGLRQLVAQKLYSAINIVGLARRARERVLIGLYVRHELSYESMFPNADRIFRISRDYYAREGSPKRVPASNNAPVAPALLDGFPRDRARRARVRRHACCFGAATPRSTSSDSAGRTRRCSRCSRSIGSRAIRRPRSTEPASHRDHRVARDEVFRRRRIRSAKR